nr:MAG TPA: hypothetical protein [Caudoviricetes sp.]
MPNLVSAARAVAASLSILLCKVAKDCSNESESIAILITLSSLILTSLPGFNLLIKSL